MKDGTNHETAAQAALKEHLRAETAKRQWLRTLAVNSIVLYMFDEDEGPAQHAIVSITLAEGQAEITGDARIEIQPEHGRSYVVDASTLQPATTVKLKVVIELEYLAGPGETAEDLRQILDGGLQSAIGQGLLTGDSAATVESHEVTTTIVESESLLTLAQRTKLLESLQEHWIDTLANADDSYVQVLARDGWSGFSRMSDAQLLSEYRQQFEEEFLDDEDSEESE